MQAQTAERHTGKFVLTSKLVSCVFHRTETVLNENIKTVTEKYTILEKTLSEYLFHKPDTNSSVGHHTKCRKKDHHQPFISVTIFLKQTRLVQVPLKPSRNTEKKDCAEN